MIVEIVAMHKLINKINKYYFGSDKPGRDVFFLLIGQFPVTHILPASHWLKVLTGGGRMRHALSGAGL